MRCIIIVLIFVNISSFSQLSVREANPPDWVTDYAFENVQLDETQITDGYAYLLISSQSNLETNEFYRKYIMKVTSSNGLSSVGNINESFDPSYETLTFHELKIIRNGKTIDKLKPSKFEVIRREEEMDRAIYDKTVNAIYNMPDLRVGDILIYSLTRKGFNPAFANHRFGSVYLQYSVPVSKIAHKLVYSKKRNLLFKFFGDSVKADEGQSGSFLSKMWIRENIPGMILDDQLPSWYDPYPHLQYSDFQSWNDVKSWAQSLYQFPSIKSGNLRKIIEHIKSQKGGNTEEAIRACIRVAQGNIRYLSFSDGIHGYKPHSPDLVYEQKYGDCKDKSFLLSYMLNEIGVESAPALVSTEDGFRLKDFLPNPWAFNHCIVQFTLGDSTYWIDPTLRQQLGPINSYYFPSYYHALVIDDKNNNISDIPFGYKNSQVEVLEDYSMKEVGGSVELRVKSTYYGDEADRMRNYFRTNSIDQINKDYLNFYAKDYSEISLKSDVEIFDDTLMNVVQSTEQYLVDNFWEIRDNNKSADIYAGVLSSYLKKPNTRIRDTPLAISHPQNISQTIKIHLPEDWNLDDSHVEIESPAFSYKSSKYCFGTVITMKFLYKTKTEFLEAKDVSEHIDKVDQALEDTGLTIYSALESTKTKRNQYVLFAVVIAVGIFLSFITFRRN